MPAESGRPPVIAITSGEPAGVGPELIGAIRAKDFAARLIILGDEELIRNRCRQVGRPVELIPYPRENTASPTTPERSSS